MATTGDGNGGEPVGGSALGAASASEPELPATEGLSSGLHSIHPKPKQTDGAEAEAAMQSSAPEAGGSGQERSELELDVDVAGEDRSFTPSRPPSVARFDRYEILGRLATGGMANVYLARESNALSASRLVVLKFVKEELTRDPDFVSMFLDEGRVALGLTHPNICHVYEFGQRHGRYFIAMEWVNGATLGDMLERAEQQGTRLPVPIAVRIASRVAEALDYAHRFKDEHGRNLGIVHRDVSLQNIMLSYTGAVKLLDFGVAKASFRATSTQAGQLKGKFAYVSPEQVRDTDALDGRSDVFSLGVCLYESLTGQRLYARESEYDMLHAILHDPVPSIRKVVPSLPAELDTIVAKALAKDPAARWATAGKLHEALESYLTRRREVVSSTRLAEQMRTLFGDEIEAGPKLDAHDVLHRTFAPRSRASLPAPEQVYEKAPWIMLGMGAGLIAAASLLLVAGLITWWLWPSGSDDVNASLDTANAPETAPAQHGQEATEAAGAAPVDMDFTQGENLDLAEEADAIEQASDTAATSGEQRVANRFAQARALARAHYRAGRLQQAAEAYAEATRLRPSHAGSHAGLGATLVRLERFGPAIKAYEEAVRRAPKHSGYHAALGYAYERAGRNVRAASAYRDALKLDRGNGAARDGLARLR